MKHGIVGTLSNLKKSFNVVHRSPPTDITVDDLGESGVGKEVMAQAIHAASKRSKKTDGNGQLRRISGRHYWKANCSAMEKGSFNRCQRIRAKDILNSRTAARSSSMKSANFPRHAGKVSPHSGEWRIYCALALQLPARSMCASSPATNKDLDRRSAHQAFPCRPVLSPSASVNMRIPPLRERRGDIPVLFDKFAKDYATANAIAFGGITKRHGCAVEVLLARQCARIAQCRGKYDGD